ncbi:MAG TPA: SIMPL domain-containing protein [Armatimonadota bacterium]|nr:SIMPL domain-containing protein [Armatimonadota bacterium]
MQVRFLLLIILTGVFTAALMAQQRTNPPVRTITVTGTAERMANPDLGVVTLAVQTQADTVSTAVSQNNTLTGRVTDAIRALNIRGVTMRTLGFDVQPIYEQPTANRPVERPLRIIAYQVVNRLEVRIPEANPDRLSENISKVLSAGLAAGANRVDNVSFMLVNDLPVLREALAEATRNAHGTAAAMADAAGVHLGQLMSLSSSPIYRQPPTPLMARAETAANAVPIVAGPFTIDVTVSAVYEIQ